MATHPHIASKARSFGENMESDLALEFLRVVEEAALASARTMGQGERKLSDEVATEAMRKTMDTIPMHGTIVIGEGERDEAPMLYLVNKNAMSAVSTALHNVHPVALRPQVYWNIDELTLGTEVARNR